MSDAVITAIVGAIGAVLAGFIKLIHWAVKEWASVRREAIKAESETAAQERAHNERLLELQRSDNARMREALLEQARTNTAQLEQGRATATALSGLGTAHLELGRATTAALAELGTKLESLFGELRARRSYNGSRGHQHDD